MLASTICDDKSAAGQGIVETGNITAQRVGSDSYQQDHMGLIFQEGLSFSGFERNKVFLGQKSGKFADLSRVSGADSESDCRAVLVADFDDDGDCDLFVNAIQRDCHHLFRNDLPRDQNRQSIKLRFRATSGHPDAVGAIVKIHQNGTTQARVLTCGTGFVSQDADEIVFGLGGGQKARITVRWPGRAEEDFGELAAGRYTLVEGSGKAESRAAATFSFADPPPRGVKVRVNDKLTSLDLLTVDGKSQKVSLESEPPVLLNFWSTTCTSCLAEMPELARLHKEKKYRVVAVSLDPAARGPVIEKHRKRFGMNFDVFRIDDPQADELFDLSRLSIPVTFLLDKDGRVDRILQGRIKKGDL